jgi:diadenosine tetraphosphate (Ap4A) HIT family hydrolase
MSEPSKCGICGAIEQIRANKFPDFIAELDHSFVILGDAQFYRGYCILFAKRHERELFLLPRSEALALTDELCSVAEAINTVVHPLKLNYECLGNSEPHIHWHVFPRYQSEEEDLRVAPVWMRPADQRRHPLPDNDRRALIASLQIEIAKRIVSARILRD